MPEKVLKSPDLGFLEKRGDPVKNVYISEQLMNNAN